MAGGLMSAEMAEQPAVLARLIDRAAGDAALVRDAAPGPLAGVVFLARGSSDNAAVFGRYLTELAAGRPVGLAAPSLYTRYHAEVDWSGYLVVALSQSGSTPEILNTCAAVRAAGASLIGITNEPGSPMADAVDVLLSTDAGPELAVPATKTMTAQMLLLATVAAALDRRPAGPTVSLAALPSTVAAILDNPGPAADLASRWRGIDRLVVSGRGLAYAAALEIALKVKETTGILAEGMSVADLRHGPIAAAYAGAPVLLVDAGGPAAADIGELLETLHGRGAEAATLPLPPGLQEPAQVIAAVVRGQQVARSLALAKGADPDAPAGLTKVTPTT
ncbi:MAG: SIS domain-containing protein [Streptosporangiaceae bacterium]|nr:SIS domain-containing protein [Streptosporangiaceae bacterium]MBV9855215.1 SIS domain-containing protein [Streptosporangiaceae bacterium]